MNDDGMATAALGGVATLRPAAGSMPADVSG